MPLRDHLAVNFRPSVIIVELRLREVVISLDVKNVEKVCDFMENDP